LGVVNRHALGHNALHGNVRVLHLRVEISELFLALNARHGCQNGAEQREKQPCNAQVVQPRHEGGVFIGHYAPQPAHGAGDALEGGHARPSTGAASAPPAAH